MNSTDFSIHRYTHDELQQAADEGHIVLQQTDHKSTDTRNTDYTVEEMQKYCRLAWKQMDDLVHNTAVSAGLDDNKLRGMVWDEAEQKAAAAGPGSQRMRFFDWMCDHRVKWLIVTKPRQSLTETEQHIECIVYVHLLGKTYSKNAATLRLAKYEGEMQAKGYKLPTILEGNQRLTPEMFMKFIGKSE